MSPQEDVSGSPLASGAKTPVSPVCAEVRVIMDAVRDNRATTADRVFVATHTEHCAGCASEWAFLQATKTAWAKMPVSYPSASLSARIAAATYRKPTFAERFASVFAFLNPVPMRVAIGVAAVAGISFLALPRVTEVPAGNSPRLSEPGPAIVTEASPAPQPEIAVAPVEPTDPSPKEPAIRATPKPAAKPAPEAERRLARQDRPAPAPVAISEEKITPKVESAAPKQKPTQVAVNTAKSVRQSAHTVVAPPVESTMPDAKPPVKESPDRVVTVATPDPGVAAPRPEPKLPEAVPVAKVTGMTAPETDPDFTGGSNRISLRNTNQALPAKMSGGVVRTSSPSDAGFIVSMDAKL